MTQTIIHVPASEGGGAFDPTDIELTDNTSGAFLVKEGSNEYIRIDTTDGAEQVRINNPAVSSQFLRFQKVSATSDYVQLKNGAYSQVYMNRAGGAYNTEVTGTKVLNKLVSPSFTGLFQIMANTGSVLIQEVDTDTNFTHTLAQSGSNYFTVKNDASANHCFRVNGNNRHTEIERIGFGGTQYIGYSGDYIQRSQPAHIDATSEVTSTSSLAVPDMNGSPGSGTFNNINKSTAIRIHSASQSASGDLFTATLNVSDAYKDLFREMFLYVTNYDSTNAFALKIQASSSSGNWRELNSSGITGGSGQTIDAATTYVYRIFQHAPGNSTATRVYGIHFMGKMAH